MASKGWKRRKRSIQLARILLPPRSLPRDIVEDRVVRASLVDHATKYAGLFAILTFVLVVGKVALEFGGDINYATAALERTSLASLATMTLASMAEAALPFVLVLSAVDIGSPATSRIMRRALRFMWLALLPITLSSVNRLTFLGCLMAYLLTRTLTIRARPQIAGPNPPDLVEWGRINRRHPDIVIWQLARQARFSQKLDLEGRKELVEAISKRVAALKPAPEYTRILRLTAGTGAFILSVLTAPPTYSARYSVQTTQGGEIAYMLRGAGDVMLINADTRRPTILPSSQVLSWRLCGPSPETGHAWILRPITSWSGDSNPVC